MNDEKKEEGPRSFARFVEQVADGQCHNDLSQELHELLKVCGNDANARRDVSRGKLTLELSLKVDPEPGRVVGVVYSIKTKHPEKKRPAGLFWLTKGGNLTVENPRQQTLPLREVPAAKNEAVELDASASAREG